MNLIEITDINAPELDVFSRITEPQLRNTPLTKAAAHSSPERLALVPVSGSPVILTRARASELSGQRSPTVFPPAVRTSGTISFFFSTIVSGPGQKASASA